MLTTGLAVLKEFGVSFFDSTSRVLHVGAVEQRKRLLFKVCTIERVSTYELYKNNTWSTKRAACSSGFRLRGLDVLHGHAGEFDGHLFVGLQRRRGIERERHNSDVGIWRRREFRGADNWRRRI